MRSTYCSQGTFPSIEWVEDTRIILRSERADGASAFQRGHLVVLPNVKQVRISAEPPELLPMLAETGNFGITLIGDPAPDVTLMGVVFPGRGQDDVACCTPRRLGGGPLRLVRD